MIQKWLIDYLVNQVFAYILRWLDSNQPTQARRDPKPAPIIKPKTSGPKKYTPVATAPGTWNKAEGRWN